MIKQEEEAEEAGKGSKAGGSTGAGRGLQDPMKTWPSLQTGSKALVLRFRPASVLLDVRLVSMHMSFLRICTVVSCLLFLVKIFAR